MDTLKLSMPMSALLMTIKASLPHGVARYRCL